MRQVLETETKGVSSSETSSDDMRELTLAIGSATVSYLSV
jgi:hypothetical protein